MIYGMFLPPALHAVASLQVADVLADGPLDSEGLAARCGADSRSLHRLMRYLVGEGVFSRQPDGRFANNAASDTLRTGVTGSTRAMALNFGAGPVWRAWGELLGAIQNGGSAFKIAHGEEFFPYIAKHPDDAAIFNNFMTELAARRTPAAMYDFSGLKTIVDVGGGQGLMLGSILQAHPNSRGILFDAPDLVGSAGPILTQFGVADRCELAGGSFFEAVPEGGDGYILSNILHDWNDDDSLRILRTCRAAMKPGTVLLVVELVVEEDDKPSLAKTVDMQMLTILGGVQRTRAEFQALFDAAGFGRAEVDPRGIVTTVAV
jgi:hypothetical protein